MPDHTALRRLPHATYWLSVAGSECRKTCHGSVQGREIWSVKMLSTWVNVNGEVQTIKNEMVKGLG